MKKIIWLPVLPVLLVLLLTGCGSREKKPLQYTDYTVFDTVTTIVGFGESPQAFEDQAKEICRQLQSYHRQFDIYHTYEGIQNLKTVNDQAGIAPVRVEPCILELLQDCRNVCILTDGRVNVAMGSVLELWHAARTQSLDHPEHPVLPDRSQLIEAAKHCSMDDVILDREAGTVFLRDPRLRLDVGAIAKGWAVERVCRDLPAGLLVSVGGNVRATGPKPDGSPWIVGIQNPEGNGYLAKTELSMGSAVTSGDYQRFFTVDGKQYHHIIDPDTLQPSEYWRSVTVLCEDSGMADALSTALFVLPMEKGQALLDALGAEAMWMDRQGQMYYSPGFLK